MRLANKQDASIASLQKDNIFVKSISISIIGSGLGGLSAAISLAHAGYDVTVYEKNPTPGGKARSMERNGLRFV